MGRPVGSKNKPKGGCTKLSHCLETELQAQDQEHLERENHKSFTVINGDEEDSESEYESEYDDSVVDKDYEMPLDQGVESLDGPTTSIQVVSTTSFPRIILMTCMYILIEIH